METFFENFHETEKCIMFNSIQVLANQVSKNPSLYFEDIDLLESHRNLHKKPSETLG